MRLFRWLSARAIPPSLDLRRCGWSMVAAGVATDDGRPSPALAHAGCLDDHCWSALGEWRWMPLRGLVLLIGIDDEEARARLLRLGFGDVIGRHTGLGEIAERALRISARAAVVPRLRQVGSLRLDLFARDGFVGTRAIGLHPREFALIWRLADVPGAVVSKKELVRDVWRLAYVPDTNSLAVHVFRLRAKLALAGLPGIVQTAPAGGYFVSPARPAGDSAPFMLAEADGHEARAMALSVEQSLPWESQR